MSRSRVRIGVVGCGSVLRAYGSLIQKLRFERAVEVVSVCDIDKAKAEAARQRWPDAAVYTDYRDVVTSRLVDLVLVLTAMPAHGEIAGAALVSGKHVLVEKPMSTSLEGARQLLETARDSDGILVCAPHVILSPTFRIIAKRIRAGDIGRVLLARARYGWAGPTWGAWYYQPGGGALFDLGVYNVTALTALIGPARRVTAMAGTVMPERMISGQPVESQVIDNAHMLIDFGDSVFGVVTTGFSMQRYRGPAIELYGSKGTIQLMGDDWAPQGYELWRAKHGAWEVYDETDPGWQWTEGLRHLIDCIRTGQHPVYLPEHAYHVLEIMLAAEAASGDGRAREIQSTFSPLELPDADAAPEEHDSRVDRV